MQRPGRRCFGGFLAIALLYIVVTGINVYATKGTNPALLSENAEWVASSKSWLDRQMCNWFGLCGLGHVNSNGWTTEGGDGNESSPINDFWTSGQEDPATWSEAEIRTRHIPQYVLDHAPYVHLFSGEDFWPSDVAEHLAHITPKVNYTTVWEMAKDRNLTDLDELNDVERGRSGRFVYLQSNDNPEDYPDWLTSRHNIPTGADVDLGKDRALPHHPHWEPKFDLRRRQHDPEGAEDQSAAFGKSHAPVILVTVNKGDGIVDAFWFFFYSFNLGQKVVNIRFGNHVGDWEHTMIRFKDGKPDLIFLSEHNFGEAYEWNAIEKYTPRISGSESMLGTWSDPKLNSVAKRPVVYSAVGSHAMYGTPGRHPYIMPFGLLHDDTDRGPLWDPALNVKSYTYDISTKRVRSSTRNPKSPTGWFNYAGHWGDKYYPLSDRRQYRLVGQYHYVSGPTGPKFKNLGRKNVCQGHGECHIKSTFVDERHGPPPEEEVELGGLPGGNITDDLQ